MRPLAELKAALRLRLRRELHQITAAERDQASARLRANLAAAAFWKSASSLLAFVPTRTEPDIWEAVLAALEAGRLVCLPRYDPAADAYVACAVRDPERDLEPGPYGIPEPLPGCPAFDVMRLDLILVPGLGFSLAGGRLGRGKGYYDRLLAAIPGCKCGVSFEQQVIPDLPLEPHDVRLDHLVTPSRCLALPAGPGRPTTVFDPSRE